MEHEIILLKTNKKRNEEANRETVKIVNQLLTSLNNSLVLNQQNGLLIQAASLYQGDVAPTVSLGVGETRRREKLQCERGKKSFEKKEKDANQITKLYMSLSRIEKHRHARSNEIVRLDFAYRMREGKKEWMSKKKTMQGC